MPDDRSRPTGPLPRPVVAADTYDDDYFRTVCNGAREWEASGGSAYKGLYEGYAARAGLVAGDVLVDFGTGRGEMLAVAAERGAVAVGIEYAAAGLDRCRRTVAASDTAFPVAGDVRSVPLCAGIADVVTMFDIVEHLAPDELRLALAEARRLLRPGGRLLVHTMPTRTVYDITYRVQRWSRPSRWRRWPADPRSLHERAMHVNEQTPRRLRASVVSAGFVDVDVALGAWVLDEFVPDARARRAYHRLARRRLTAPLGVCDVWADARAPANTP